jgi:hypothetical protein
LLGGEDDRGVVVAEGVVLGVGGAQTLSLSFRRGILVEGAAVKVSVVTATVMVIVGQSQSHEFTFTSMSRGKTMERKGAARYTSDGLGQGSFRSSSTL